METFITHDHYFELLFTLTIISVLQMLDGLLDFVFNVLIKKFF